MLRKQFGYRLQEVMENKKISYSDLAKKSDVSRDHIYHIVDGSKEVGIDTIEKLSDALEVEPKELFEFNGLSDESNVDRMVVNEFRSLPSHYWDFVEAKTDYLIHSLHNYPAVMIWPISNTIIRIVQKYKPVHSLLDPFVGSGTVLVEAQRSGIKNVYGNDLNPLALLITKAKTTLLSEEDIDVCNRIADELTKISEANKDLIDKFVDDISKNYSIVDKGEWSSLADEITNDYFKETPLETYKVPKIDNLGFWFRPESVIEIEIIKDVIDKNATENSKSFLNCTLSETIRLVSNTRNGEFKLYRKPTNRILEKKHDPINTFLSNLKKNLLKEDAYLKEASKVSYVTTLCDNTQHMPEITDDSIDVVITSPPYGDSHTTVAYGQYSRLSNTWLGLSNEKNLDADLLGGRKIKNRDISELQSETLKNVIQKISASDEKRAREVLDFYFELDSALAEITRKVKVGGYEFWVVGNRTVKLVNIPTDIILEELGKKYHLLCLDRYYRMISNKVMPNLNSPTNVAGNHAQTMTSEIIVFFKKTL